MESPDRSADRGQVVTERVLRRLSRDVLLDGPEVLASAADGTAWWCPAKAA
jgi:hypothetical protein